MRVTVIGTGYVGTVTGACLAYLGHRVTCVDTDAHKIAKLRRGESPIYEPQLEEMLALAARARRHRFSPPIWRAAAESDVIFIAVGTPPLPSGEANLEYLEAAARASARPWTIRASAWWSTSRPCRWAAETWWKRWCGKASADRQPRRPAIRFGVASNPEFLREGSAVADSLYPDRIVVGAGDAA
jgi:UDPglucose 6-dehydrogenase